MEAKTIKISEENYRWLLHLAGELQKIYGKPVSFDNTLTELKKMKRKKISNLAGSWKMSDAESEEFMSDIKRGWKKWKIASA